MLEEEDVAAPVKLFDAEDACDLAKHLNSCASVRSVGRRALGRVPLSLGPGCDLHVGMYALSLFVLRYH